MFAHRLTGFALALAFAACERPRALEAAGEVRPPPTFRASCTTPALGVCTEYTDDAFALGETFLERSCLEGQGSWSPARCALGRHVGRCALRGSTRVYYPGGALDFSSTTAARDCVELYQGVFSAR